ncbi:putative pentatricopeptide repeat-containing protein-like [Capsicum annuum]|nr:putative pentatricopeptide repeat-containing protein-like [Capsicum annuum]
MDVDGARGIYFNEEIVVDILSRLSVRSLLRFKCVSKFWMALISEPCFTLKHLKLSKNNQNSPKILFLKNMFSLHFSSLTPASLSSTQFTENVQKLDWLYGGKPWSCKIYCCYDGLVLVGVRRYDNTNHLILFLWNPSTRESVVLPSTEFLPQEDYTCGLGYDSTSGDYMILKISYQSCSEILALKSGMWRIIGKPTGIYSSWLSDMDSLAFVHGAFHWLGLSRNDSVTSYDITNEVFKEIPLLDGMFVVPDMKYVKHGLSVLGEMICICSTHRDQWKYIFNVWIMKDYGVKESWNRFFTIQSADLYSLVPEYRFSDGEVLLRCKHFDRCGYLFNTTKESSGFWPQYRSECRALSFLCSILPYQTRLTYYQPAKGCEVRPGTRNESIFVHGSFWPAAVQLFERNAMCWFRLGKGRMPGRRSSTVGSRRVRFGSQLKYWGSFYFLADIVLLHPSSPCWHLSCASWPSG